MTWLDDLERVLADATAAPWAVAKGDAFSFGIIHETGYSPQIVASFDAQPQPERDAEAIVALRNRADLIVELLREAQEIIGKLEGPYWEPQAWLARFAQPDEEG